jgi:hypothetical protein
LDAPKNAVTHLPVGDGAIDFVEEAIEDFAEIVWIDHGTVRGGEILRQLSLQQPGGGSPVLMGGPLNRLQRAESGRELGLPKAVPKFFVASSFAMDGAGGAPDVVGSGFDAATVGDEGEDFTLFDFVESAGAAGF